MRTLTGRATVVGGNAFFFVGFAISVLADLHEGAFVALPVAFAILGLVIGRVIGTLLEPPEPGLEEIRIPLSADEEGFGFGLAGARAAAASAGTAPGSGATRPGQLIDTVLPEIPPS